MPSTAAQTPLGSHNHNPFEAAMTLIRHLKKTRVADLMRLADKLGVDPGDLLRIALSLRDDLADIHVQRVADSLEFRHGNEATAVQI